VSDSKLRLPKPKLTNHPVDVGQRTEAAILSELVRRGYSVLLPFGVNQRYDLVLDLGGRYLRAQCKTGRLHNGVVLFSTKSVQCNTRRTLVRDYDGEADVFLVHCPATDRVYCVPVAEVPTGYMYLRVKPTLNGQAHGIRWASDYELPA
jgi:PD-(D/E)XK endonuclease